MYPGKVGEICLRGFEVSLRRPMEKALKYIKKLLKTLHVCIHFKGNLMHNPKLTSRIKCVYIENKIFNNMCEKCYVFSVKPVRTSKACKKVSPTFSGYIQAHSDSNEVLELENAKTAYICSMSRLPSNIVKKCWTIDLKCCYYINESTQEEAFGMQHNPYAPKVSKVSKSQILSQCHWMASAISMVYSYIYFQVLVCAIWL